MRDLRRAIRGETGYLLPLSCEKCIVHKSIILCLHQRQANVEEIIAAASVPRDGFLIYSPKYLSNKLEILNSRQTCDLLDNETNVAFKHLSHYIRIYSIILSPGLPILRHTNSLLHLEGISKHAQSFILVNESARLRRMFPSRSLLVENLETRSEIYSLHGGVPRNGRRCSCICNRATELHRNVWRSFSSFARLRARKEKRSRRMRQNCRDFPLRRRPAT